MSTSRETIELSRIVLNDANPRTITERKFEHLVESLVEFPEMLKIRSAVVKKTDAETYVVLGGNMRTRAKQFLFDLDGDEKVERIENAVATRGLDEHGNHTHSLEKREHYRALLEELFYSDSVEVEVAHGLTPAQELEFVVKDNTDFGAWDYDALANHNYGEPAQLTAWGVEGMPRESSITEAADDLNDGVGDGESSNSRATMLEIRFDSPEDVQAAENELLEYLEDKGYNGFSIKAVVPFN